MRYVTALLTCSAFLSGSDWPQFRGPAASGLGDGKPPTEWSGESGKNILWKTAIPGLAHSSPVIWGDKIFVTSAVPAEGEASLKVGLYGNIQSVENEPSQSFNVYCIDRKSGKMLWQRTAYTGQPKIKRHTKATHANSSPATDGKHLVVWFGSEGLYTYDLDGKLLWKKDLGVLDSGFYMVPSAQWGFSASPVIHEKMVILQADVQKDSFLAAVDIDTGKELWRTKREDVPTFGSPAVVPYTAGGRKDLQVVVNGWKHIGGYDLKTGKELWRMTSLGGDIPVPTPVFADGVIVLTSAHGKGRPIYAIRTDAAGEIDDKNPAMAWTVPNGGNYMQTPVLAGGLAYFCFDNGILTVYQIKTGEKLYQQRLGGGTSGFSASAVAAGGKLYVTSEEGTTFVLAQGGEYKLLAQSELGETVMASPAIAGDVLYLRGRKHLFAIGTK